MRSLLLKNRNEKAPQIIQYLKLLALRRLDQQKLKVLDN